MIKSRNRLFGIFTTNRDYFISMNHITNTSKDAPIPSRYNYWYSYSYHANYKFMQRINNARFNRMLDRYQWKELL